MYTTSVDISMIFLYNASSVLCIAQSDAHVRTNTGTAIGEKSFQITISGLLSSTNYKAYCKVNGTEIVTFYASLYNPSKGWICPNTYLSSNKGNQVTLSAVFLNQAKQGVLSEIFHRHELFLPHRRF